jgi:lysophospholipase L1-like esterase
VLKLIGAALKVGALLVAGFVLLIGAEILLVIRREFPLNDPEQPVSGEFGNGTLPRLRFVVLGDSTSVGVGTTPDKSFPWLLASRLGERFNVALEVVGFGGATTKDLADHQVSKAIALKPDLVLVEIGANDTTHASLPWTVRSKIGESLDRLIDTKATVVVAGPPDMGKSPVMAQPLKALAGLLSDNVTKIIETETRKRKLPYIDLARGIGNEELPPGFRYYSSDNFHPGEGGYGLWAKVMYPTVLEAALRAAEARDGRAAG